ncbi:MAG: hypothetical protein R3B57_03550 [Phycisphaerales bacterium]
MTCKGRCNCCESGAGHTPIERVNRSGLDAVSYRVGTFASFRKSMLDRIAGTQGLTDLRTRDSDDYAITVLEGWAAVADVLTFYEERYAQELFLRTSVFRDSVLRLARMIGYELSPGAAATALLAFEASDKVTIPAYLLVQSVPDDDTPDPQKFETLEQIIAWPSLNSVPVVGVPEGVNPLARGSVWAWLEPGEAGAVTAAELAPGHKLLIIGDHASELVELESIERVGARARLRWTAAIVGAGWDVRTPVYRAGERYTLFGVNAPTQYAAPASGATNLAETIWEWTSTKFEITSKKEVTLDGVIDDLEVGDRVLVSAPARTKFTLLANGRIRRISYKPLREIATIADVQESDVSVGPLTGTATKLTFKKEIASLEGADLRHVRITKLIGDQVRFWGMRYPENIASGAALIPGERTAPETIRISDAFDGTELVEGDEIEVADIEVGRRLILSDDSGAVDSGEVVDATVVRDEPTVSSTDDDASTAGELGLEGDAVGVLSGVASGPIEDDTSPLSASAPRLVVRVGDAVVEIELTPSGDLDAIAGEIESAIRAAGDEDSLSGGIAAAVDDRLVILAGDDSLVEVEPAPSDASTFAELGFDDQQPLTALSGEAPASDPLTLSASAPEIAIAFGPLSAVTVSGIGAASASLDARASELQTAINQSDAAPLFAQACVLVHDGRFVILGGPVGSPREHYLRLGYTPDGDGAELDAASATLQGNVALASHGESVSSEILGSGDGKTPFLSFELADSPVTHLSTGAGVESTLTVRVDGAAWTRVDSFYGLSDTDRVYRQILADDGTTTVMFGDGVTGVIPPSGVGNITAEYRVGLGLDGRVAQDALRTLLSKPTGLDSVINPSAADGGADAQLLDDARTNAPATVRTFGRAVSLLDYEDLVKESGEVSKALATNVWRRDRRAVHLTVGAQGGALFSDSSLESILEGLGEARDPNHELSIDNYTPVPIVVHAMIRVDAAYVVDDVVEVAHQALSDAFSYDTLTLGQPVPLSDVYVVLQNVTGVSSVFVQRLMFRQDEDVSDAQFDDFLDDRGVERDSSDAPISVQPRLRIYPARADNLAGTVTPAELAVVTDASRDIVITGGQEKDLA